MTNIKTNSTYETKKGVKMRQINLAVRSDIADKFDQLCGGLSKSVIFSQMVNEKCTNQIVEPTPVPAKTGYSLLDGN